MSKKNKGNQRGRRVIIPAPKLELHLYTKDLLCNEYWKPIYRLALQMTRNHWDSEDITQQVMEKILKGWERIQWENLAGFIATIFHNAKSDYYTQMYNRPSVGAENPDQKIDYDDRGDSDPLRLLIRGDAYEQVLFGLDRLKQKDRMLLLDRILTDKSVEELSVKYGIKTPQGVYEKISRIRKVLTAKCGGTDFLPNGEWNSQYDSVPEWTLYSGDY